MKMVKYLRLFSGILPVLLLISSLLTNILPGTDEATPKTYKEGMYENEYGARDYKLYFPDGYNGQRLPLVVMLHGCGQEPADFAKGTKMNQLADEYRFIVLYPTQSWQANLNHCWNWFEREHQQRDRGEPAILAGMTQEIIDQYNIQHKQVYVAGMSAGGAMSVILGAAYPDLYTVIGVSVGIMYNGATNVVGGLTVMALGGADPHEKGRLAYEASGDNNRVVPVIVFHGNRDLTVNVKNGHQTISQWAKTNDLADDGIENDSITDQHYTTIRGEVPGGHSYIRSLYSNQKGSVIMEKWIVDKMGHHWSGGSAEGSYTDPKGPDASREMIRFFFEHRH